MITVAEKEKKECCGCSLCVNVCPKNAISMVADDEGFMYPSVDTKACISCGLCITHCSFVVSGENESTDYFICQSKSDEVLFNSASGGLFTHLSDVILEKGGFICGAQYNDNFLVEHSVTNSIQGRDAFRDSKYIQSSLGAVYDVIVDLLKSNKRVLFSGTPCQCASIKTFVTKRKLDISNLVLVDIICHGVGSPKIWRQYLEYMKKKYGIIQISRIKTRNKELGVGYNLTISSGDNKYYLSGKKDPFISLFSNSYIQRPSCFSCPMKSWHRCTDITIGDFQKAKEYFPNYCNGKGCSVALVNTKKGMELFDEIKKNISYDVASKQSASQISLYKSEQSNHRRNCFYTYYSKHTFCQSLTKFTEEGFFNRIKGFTKRSLKHIF